MNNILKRALAVMLAVIICALSSFAVLADAGITDTSVTTSTLPSEMRVSEGEWEILRLTNIERVSRGLAPLTTFPLVQDACGIRAEELRELFSHQRPNGSSCWTVFDELGIDYSNAGENIAAGYSSPSATVNGWMNSQGHRDNILNTGFRHMGVGYYYANASEYRYHWVQMFVSGFGCGYASLELILPDSMSFDVGTTIEEMGIIGKLRCGEYGYCYLPIASSYCSGYNPNNSGEQTVNVSCLGKTATFIVNPGSGDESLPGDVDGNGIVTVNDALLALRHALTITVLTGTQFEAADINSDGIVTTVDALEIMRISLGLI